MGGKSSSSSSNASTQTSTTTTGSATGTVGDVYQAQTFTINDQLPDSAVEVFKDLIKLSGQAIEAAGVAGAESLKTVAQFGTNTQAPDVAIAQSGQKTTYYAIAAIGIIGAAIIFKGK